MKPSALLLLVLMLCLAIDPERAHARPHPKLKLTIETVLVAVSTALDNRSSWVGTSMPGIREANPVLASNGQYRMKGLLIEDGLIGGGLVYQWLHVGRLSRTQQIVADVGDDAVAASHFVVAWHNYSSIHKIQAAAAK